MLVGATKGEGKTWVMGRGWGEAQFFNGMGLKLGVWTWKGNQGRWVTRPAFHGMALCMFQFSPHQRVLFIPEINP